MIRAYVAGPYRAPTAAGIGDNIATARRYALALWGMRIAAYCPHMNTAHFDGGAPDEVWPEGHLEWMHQASFVLVLPRGEASSGTVSEVQEALRLAIPVFVCCSAASSPVDVAVRSACRITRVGIDDMSGAPVFEVDALRGRLSEWVEETTRR